MDCPICFEAISASTGIVTTSCGHSYHFSCISSWYSKQEVGTCPCCRAEAKPTEAMPVQYEEDEDEDESDYESDEEEIEFTRELLNAWLRKQGGTGLTDSVAEFICPELGAFTRQELQALCFGNGGGLMGDDEWEQLLRGAANARREVWWFVDPQTMVKNVTNPEETLGIRAWIAEDGCPLTDTLEATLMMQSLWRGFKARRDLRALSAEVA